MNDIKTAGEAEKILLLQLMLDDCRQYTSDCRIEGDCVVASNKALPIYRNISSKYNSDAHRVLISQKGSILRFRIAKNYERIVHNLVKSMKIAKDLYSWATAIENAYRGHLLGQEGHEKHLLGASFKGIGIHDVVLECIDGVPLPTLAKSALERYGTNAKQGEPLKDEWVAEWLGIVLRDRELLGRVVVRFLQKVWDARAAEADLP